MGSASSCRLCARAESAESHKASASERPIEKALRCPKRVVAIRVLPWIKRFNLSPPPGRDEHGKVPWVGTSPPPCNTPLRCGLWPNSPVLGMSHYWRLRLRPFRLLSPFQPADQAKPSRRAATDLVDRNRPAVRLAVPALSRSAHRRRAHRGQRHRQLFA